MDPFHRRVERHYDEAGDGFELWSRGGNLHYGYWTPGINPLRREAMLERMNQEVCDRFADSIGRDARVLDAGCGYGATCRTVAERFPTAEVFGITNSESQVRAGAERMKRAGVGDRITLLYAEFQSVPLPHRSVDAAYALESTAYAPTTSKRDLLRECYRLVRPGGTFVFADVYLKRERPLPPVLSHLDRAWHRCGETRQIGNVDEVRRTAADVGFEDLSVTDVSWNVAPFMLHIPVVVARLVGGTLLRGRWLNVEERKLATALSLSVCLGLFKSHYGYYIVSGRRPDE